MVNPGMSALILHTVYIAMGDLEYSQRNELGLLRPIAIPQFPQSARNRNLDFGMSVNSI